MNARCSCSPTSSDPHLPPMPRPRVRDLLGKRITGYLNWQIRRAPHHLPGTIDAIVNDVVAARPDHVVVTGDLVNLALPDEFAMARKFLSRLGTTGRSASFRATTISMCAAPKPATSTAWRDFLSVDEAGKFAVPLSCAGAVRSRSSARRPRSQRLPFFATGRLRGEQLAAARVHAARSASRKVLPRRADPSSTRRRAPVATPARRRDARSTASSRATAPSSFFPDTTTSPRETRLRGRTAPCPLCRSRPRPLRSAIGTAMPATISTVSTAHPAPGHARWKCAEFRANGSVRSLDKSN